MIKWQDDDWSTFLVMYFMYFMYLLLCGQLHERVSLWPGWPHLQQTSAKDR
jgi:hypothetical protein